MTEETTHQPDLRVILIRLSNADSSRLFSFSSGHVGSLPIQGRALARLLGADTCRPNTLLLKLLTIEMGRVLLEACAPLQHVKLVARTVLRRLRGLRSRQGTAALTVCSIGINLPADDPYMGKLLAQLTEPFDYITIAGGGITKSHNSILVETLLAPWQIGLICLSLPLQVPIQLYRLLVTICRVKGVYEKYIFLLFGLSEIVSARVMSQEIVVQAMAQYLRRAKPQCLLYPMEGRNWEKQIVRAAKSARILSYGYLHCALTPRHLSLKHNDFMCPSERPDRMIAPSMMARNILNKSYGDIVQKGYFIRTSSPDKTVNDATRASVLFALIGDLIESESIIKKLAVLSKNLQQDIVVRLNPNTASFLHLSNLTRRCKLKLYDPVSPYLPTVCFFRSSSVALEYLRLNVYPIYVELEEPISNNIFELDNKFEIERVSLDEISPKYIETLLGRELKINGKEIANYYLDENFELEDLCRLII